MSTAVRPLSDIASDIWDDWEKVNFAALPYLEAMLQLDKVSDVFGPGRESARTIVSYFLGNASTWRGDNAKRIKAELRAMITKA